MTEEEILDAVEKIRASSGDSEEAHGLEDCLLFRFIHHVATVGPPELAALARQVLGVEAIKYDRWYA